MLWRKMLRELKGNFGQFFSVFLLSALALTLFVTFEGHVLSQHTARVLTMILAVCRICGYMGRVIGILWLCPIMMDLFAQWYIVPGIHSVFHPVYFVVAVGIVFVCALSSYLSCRKLLRVKSSESLRPAAPKAGKRCIFERLPFWRRLSFEVQYNLRDISRSRLRAFMGIMGTAVGMLLMIYGVRCNGMVGQMKELAFDKTAPAKYQVKLSLDAKLSDAEELSKELDGELVMVDAVEVSAARDASSSEKKKRDGNRDRRQRIL